MVLDNMGSSGLMGTLEDHNVGPFTQRAKLAKLKIPQLFSREGLVFGIPVFRIQHLPVVLDQFEAGYFAARPINSRAMMIR